MFSGPRREDGLKDLRGKGKKWGQVEKQEISGSRIKEVRSKRERERERGGRRGAQLSTYRRNFLTALLCPEEQNAVETGREGRKTGVARKINVTISKPRALNYTQEPRYDQWHITQRKRTPPLALGLKFIVT
ncbi:hypothetical protein G5I_01590 [Acromyrmex echinatior]|uniref:Uncharacterized protein n=1 Tax=Acromyrmex echinatior TaxID=103372 RepID=F4W813_ACREC|nr:hypothetical protein G5I_01590 [Acromyrmex echinatior]